jgi:hypothetical protein
MLAKLRKATISFVIAVRLSVCPHGKNRRPLDGFSWNLIFVYFSKICLESSRFIQIWQEKRVLYMKTDIHLWSYLAQFLEWETFQTKAVEKIKIHFSFSTIPFSKIVPFMRQCAKYRTARLAMDDNIIRRMRIAYWIPKATNTHSEYAILIAFPLQQWLHERISMLHCVYNARLVHHKHSVYDRYSACLRAGLYSK